MSKLHWVAILGRRDAPTDALRDYCGHLSEALARRGVQLETIEVSWALEGWPRALWRLWKKSRAWRNQWVVAQYTALAWSWRGFPVGFLAVQGILGMRKARRAVVYHDAGSYGGRRFVDRIRGACQEWVMRTSCRWADRAVLTLALDKVSWLSPDRRNVVFIPVGANIPEVVGPDVAREKSCNPKTVAIFGVTGGESIARESADIGQVIRLAKSRAGELRLRVLGRNAAEAGPALRHELNGTGVEIETSGLLSPGEIAAALSSSDVFLFVRGGISSRRGSAIAAIACGLPVVAYQSEETAFPITEAGVLTVQRGDRTALAAELARVLTDDGLRRELSERSRAAQRKYFSWEVISESFLRVLADDER